MTQENTESTRVLGINGRENRVKLMQCCEFGA